MADNDRLKRSLSGFVRGVMGRFDYHALYPCAVVTQNADGTVDLQPDASTQMPGLQHVKLRYGIPGATVKVQAGTRVLLGFDNGRPDSPYAAIWDPSGVVVELDLTANTIVLNSGTKGVARVGDSVGTLAFSPGSGGASLTYNGNPVTTGTTITIQAGSSSVKAG